LKEARSGAETQDVEIGRPAHAHQNVSARECQFKVYVLTHGVFAAQHDVEMCDSFALFYVRALEGITMNMSKKEGRAVLFATIVSTFGAGGANANAVYTYTGNDFTTVTPSPSRYTSSDFVTLTLTLTAPLADNLKLVSIIPKVVAFTISDGVMNYGSGGFPFYAHEWSYSGFFN